MGRPSAHYDIRDRWWTCGVVNNKNRIKKNKNKNPTTFILSTFITRPVPPLNTLEHTPPRDAAKKKKKVSDVSAAVLNKARVKSGRADRVPKTLRRETPTPSG